MHYSSFPGRIYVEKTPEQCFKSPLPPENQKAVREQTETQVPGWMASKWTIRLNNERLYNGVKPPEEGDTREKRKNQKEELLYHLEEHDLKKNILLKNLPFGHYLKQPFYPKLAPRT